MFSHESSAVYVLHVVLLQGHTSVHKGAMHLSLNTILSLVRVNDPCSVRPGWQEVRGPVVYPAPCLCDVWPCFLLFSMCCVSAALCSLQPLLIMHVAPPPSSPPPLQMAVLLLRRHTQVRAAASAHPCFSASSTTFCKHSSFNQFKLIQLKAPQPPHKFGFL